MHVSPSPFLLRSVKPPYIYLISPTQSTHVSNSDMIRVSPQVSETTCEDAISKPSELREEVEEAMEQGTQYRNPTVSSSDEDIGKGKSSKRLQGATATMPHSLIF